MIFTCSPRFSSQAENRHLRQPAWKRVRDRGVHSRGAVPWLSSPTPLESRRFSEPNAPRRRQGPQGWNPDHPPSHGAERWIHCHVCCQLSSEKYFQKRNGRSDPWRLLSVFLVLHRRFCLHLPLRFFWFACRFLFLRWTQEHYSVRQPKRFAASWQLGDSQLFQQRQASRREVHLVLDRPGWTWRKKKPVGRTRLRF